jgi:D-3-phosphoglycerate dehydrogenase
MTVLFTAPIDFDPALVREYDNTIFVQWGTRLLSGKPPKAMPHKIWVCDPKANFIIDDWWIDRFQHLKIIATPSTGTNHIDLDACERRGVKVISLLDDRDGLNTISASAEFTFKLVLDVLRLGTPMELQGKTVGVIGYGRIGKKLHRYLEAFDALHLTSDPYKGGFIFRDISNIFEVCDVVVVCCSLTPETHHMITEQHILSMKPQARLVNTARGEVIDEEGMKRALEQRPDIRVALDVLEGETTGAANPDWFLEHGHIVTPHISGETFDSRTKAARIILNLLKKELERERQPA